MRNTPADPTAPPARAEPVLRALPWLACLFGVVPLLLAGFPLGHDWAVRARARERVPGRVGGGPAPAVLEREPLRRLRLARVPVLRAAVLGGGRRSRPSCAGRCRAARRSALIAISVALGAVRARVSRRAARARRPARPRGRADRDGVLGAASVSARQQARAQRRRRVSRPVSRCRSRWRGSRSPGARRGAASRWSRRASRLVVLAHNLTALVAVAFALGLGVVLYGCARRGDGCASAAGSRRRSRCRRSSGCRRWRCTGLIRPEELLRGKFDYRKPVPAAREDLLVRALLRDGAARRPRCCRGGARPLFRWPAQRRILVSLLGAAFGLLFLETSRSRFLWEPIPGCRCSSSRGA